MRKKETGNVEIRILGENGEESVYIPIPAGTEEFLPTKEILERFIENALQNSTYRQAMRTLKADSDEALFFAIEYLYREITLPLIKQNPEYGKDFENERRKAMSKHNKSETTRARYKILNWFVNREEDKREEVNSTEDGDESERRNQ